MKISNPDIIQLTQIKLYFLEPPLTFKLHTYAHEQLVNCIAVLKKYPFVKESDIQMLETLQKQTEDKSISLAELKVKLKQAGILIANLTGR